MKNNTPHLVAAWISKPLYGNGQTYEVEKYSDGTGQVFYNETSGGWKALYIAGTRFEDEPSGHLDTTGHEVTPVFEAT